QTVVRAAQSKPEIQFAVSTVWAKQWANHWASGPVARKSNRTPRPQGPSANPGADQAEGELAEIIEKLSAGEETASWWSRFNNTLRSGGPRGPLAFLNDAPQCNRPPLDPRVE